MEEEFLKTSQVKTCPLCKRKQLPEEQQPVAGTHCYTIKYECGAEVVCAIGYDDSATIDLKCGETKVDLIGVLIARKKARETVNND